MPYRLGVEVARSVKETVDFPKQVQGVGMELTAKSVLAFNDRGTIGFDNKDRELPRTQELPWDKYTHDRLLFPGVYLVNLNELVSIPIDKIGFAIPRSSLLRMGVSLGTAVWDPGYVGHGQVLLQVLNSFGLVLKKDARILQLVFADLESEAVQLYDGIYQGK
jgi:dUTP pyrophosphatase